MAHDEFDAAETICGFSMASIKVALGCVGILDDRNDVANVASTLSCSRSTAGRLLSALERRGFVARTTVKNQWKNTSLGWRLAFHWKPPPKLEPAVAFELDDESDVCSEIFDEVPCSILRCAPDNNEAFEEADLEVGVFVDYASPRVLALSVVVPDDYEHRDASGTIETSVFLGLDEARRFAKALQTAIERAEREIGRRAEAKPRTKKSPAAGCAPVATSPMKTPTSAAPASAPSATAAKRTERWAAEREGERERRALDATLKELTGAPTRRGKAPRG